MMSLALEFIYTIAAHVQIKSLMVVHVKCTHTLRDYKYEKMEDNLSLSFFRVLDKA